MAQGRKPLPHKMFNFKIVYKGWSAAQLGIKSSSHLPESTKLKPENFIMKVIALVLVCVASAIALPNYYGGYETAPALLKTHFEAPVLLKAAHIPIVKYHKNDDNYGTYQLDVETGDGISTVETGNLKNVGPEGPVNVKEGSYSWTSPEGQLFTVNYVADEFGYRASGSHLPTPPPIPAEIRASLIAPRVALVDNYAAPALAYSAPAPVLKVHTPLAPTVIRIGHGY